jgi:hypothetical protein
LFCFCKQQHRFNDTITLNRNDKIPYGTYAAYKLLQKEFPHAHIETNRYAPGLWRNLSSDSAKQVLLIVTKTFDPTEEDLDLHDRLRAKRKLYLYFCFADNTQCFKVFQIKIATPL